MSDDTFLPRGVRDEPVRDLARDEARTSHLIFRATDGFEVAIPERVVGRAIAIGESMAPLEWLGQLVGSRYRDAEGRHLTIDAIVRDPDAKHEPHFVSSTPASECYRARPMKPRGLFSRRLVDVDGVVTSSMVLFELPLPPPLAAM